MAVPAITCRIAFATAPYAATPTWSDISSDLLSLSIKKGRQHALDRMEAATAIITLSNSLYNYYPSNNYVLSNDAEWSTNNISYVLAKTLTSPGRGTLRIVFDLKSSNAGSIVYGRIYRNGVAIGTEQSMSSITYQTFTEDISGWSANDLIQLYLRTDTTFYTVTARNFRAGSPYYPNVLPGKRLNLRVVYSAVTYDIFTGYITDYDPNWLGIAGKGAIMRVSAVGIIGNLARLLINDGAGFSAELSGTRVGNVLDKLSANIGRDLAAGQSQIIASGAMVNVNALDHLNTVQQTELGYIFEAGDGDLQYHDRQTRMTSPYTVSQATFSDTPGNSRYVDVELEYGDDFIYNDVRVTRSGGTEQTATDATSKTNYGQRSLSRTGLLMPNNTKALNQADYLLSRYKDPVLRVKSIMIKPDANPTVLWPKVLGLDIGSRITLQLAQAVINKAYNIEGIQHDWDSRSNEWKTKWQLSDALFIVDTSSSSGYMGNSGAVYATVRNAATGTAFPDDMPAIDHFLVSSVFYIDRAMLFFDTSALPSAASIKSAVIKLRCTSFTSGQEGDVVVQNGQPTYPHDPMEAGDYALANYSGNGGSWNTVNHLTDEWISIILNATGIGWIQKGAGALTKLALIFQNDIDGNAPNGAYNNVATFYAAGAGFPAKLEIIYT